MNYLLIIFFISSSIFGLLLLIPLILAFKPPINTPKKFLKKKGTINLKNKKIVIFIGDSLTHGRVSSDYIDLLKKKLDTQSNY